MNNFLHGGSSSSVDDETGGVIGTTPGFDAPDPDDSGSSSSTVMDDLADRTGDIIDGSGSSGSSSSGSSSSGYSSSGSSSSSSSSPIDDETGGVIGTTPGFDAPDPEDFIPTSVDDLPGFGEAVDDAVSQAEDQFRSDLDSLTDQIGQTQDQFTDTLAGTQDTVADRIGATEATFANALADTRDSFGGAVEGIGGQVGATQDAVASIPRSIAGLLDGGDDDDEPTDPGSGGIGSRTIAAAAAAAAVGIWLTRRDS